MPPPSLLNAGHSIESLALVTLIDHLATDSAMATLQ